MNNDLKALLALVGIFLARLGLLKTVVPRENAEEEDDDDPQGIGFPDLIFSLKEIPGLVADNPQIKAVTFDMFGTLVQWRITLHQRHLRMWRAASKLLSRHGIEVTAADFRTIRNAHWYPARDLASASGREIQARRVLASIVSELAARQSLRLSSASTSRLARELETVLFQSDLETIIVLSEAFDVLSALKSSGLKIGLISNYPYAEDGIRSILRNANLLDFFDSVLVSSTVGFAKSEADPNFTIFKTACEALGVGPSSLLHVGDDASTDFRAPRGYGINAIVCDNREWQTSQKVTAYCRKRVGLTIPETVRAAERLHEISRDLVAPVLIGYSEDNLTQLSQTPKSLNVCIGRDGLTSFLIQRKLVEIFPEQYLSVNPRNIRYVPISRRLAAHPSDSYLKTYLDPQGFSSFESIQVIDFGICGSIQNRLHSVYPDKNIRGRYVMSHRMSADPFRHRKSGFLVQTDGSVFGFASNTLNVTGGHTNASLAAVFLSLDFIHFFEAIWNGIYDSVTHLVDSETAAKEKMLTSPGCAGELAEMCNPEVYQAFKKIALRGIIDGVISHKAQQQPLEESIERLADWFTETATTDGLDRRLIKALAPAFFGSAAPGGGYGG